MFLEMALLVLIALLVFAYVLAPVVRPSRPSQASEDVAEDEPVEEREPVASDGQPVRDSL